MNLRFLILICFLVLAQTVFFPFNLAMMAVLFLGIVGVEERKVLILSFWSGLILDLFWGGKLGLSSLAFLVLSLAIFAIKRYLAVFRLVTIFFLALFADLSFNFFIFHFFKFNKSLVSAFIFLFVFFLWGRNKMRDGNQLKLELKLK